ncbi:hypothetical protein PTKIN_Ptkin11bG0207400 [Pterospermum kingtungense]
MESVAEGLWGLADYHEKKGEIGKAVKCLEAICQSHVSFLPIVEVKTRLRIATLLLRHSQNVTHAKSHLERSQLLLNSIPSCFDLKCRTYALLSQCYHLVGAIPPQKQILYKALQLTSAVAPDVSVKLWCCNFNSQLANALIIEGDYQNSISTLESGYVSASQICYPELQMFFAASILHVRLLMQWDDQTAVEVEQALNRCDQVWDTIPSERRAHCLGLLFYNELSHIFYRLRISDYKNAVKHVDNLDAAIKQDTNNMSQLQQLTLELNALNQSLSRSDIPPRERSALSARHTRVQGQLTSMAIATTSSTSAGNDYLEPTYFGNTRRALQDKLLLAPPPINGEWLPKSAVYALVDLIVIIFGRPKGNFKECDKRIQSGMHIIEEELVRLGITDGVREVDLQHSAIWMAGVYLMLLMQFLENKVAVDLTRSEFLEAQEITESKSMQIMCQAYAAVSYLCIGDAESSSQALDLIGPLYRMKDSFIGLREEASILFAYGLLLMKQQDLQEARNRLAKGLQIAHVQMGNLQLVSQYLTILGNLALALHDTGQAREILRSSLTLAKKLGDIPTQIWVLFVLTGLFQQLGEKGNEMENDDYRRKKFDELQKRLADARSSIHHIELIDKVKLEVQRFHEHDMKRTMAGQSMTVNLDIPESVGLSTPMPVASSSRLVDLDTRRRGKRKF